MPVWLNADAAIAQLSSSASSGTNTVAVTVLQGTFPVPSAGQQFAIVLNPNVTPSTAGQIPLDYTGGTPGFTERAIVTGVSGTAPALTFTLSANLVNNHALNEYCLQVISAAELATLSSSAVGWNPTAKTSAYAANALDFVLANGTSAGFNITLPAPSAGAIVGAKRTDNNPTNIVLLKQHASETIDGAASYSLTTQYDEIQVISDGTNWFRMSPLFGNTQFETAVQSYGPNQFAAASGNTNMGGFQVTNMGDGLSATAGATIQQLAASTTLITSSGTFTPSISGNYLVACVGGGGQGGGGYASTTASANSVGGAGGGSGATAMQVFTLAAGTGYAYTVGAGGTGGGAGGAAAGNNAGANGGNGGSTTFNSALTANGGGGGSGGPVVFTLATSTLPSVGGAYGYGGASVAASDGTPIAGSGAGIGGICGYYTAFGIALAGGGPLLMSGGAGGAGGLGGATNKGGGGGGGGTATGGGSAGPGGNQATGLGGNGTAGSTNTGSGGGGGGGGNNSLAGGNGGAGGSGYILVIGPLGPTS